MLGRPKMAYYIEEDQQDVEELNFEEQKSEGFDDMFANFSNSQTKESMHTIDQKATKNTERIRQSIKQAGVVSRESEIKLKTFRGLKTEVGDKYDMEQA